MEPLRVQGFAMETLHPPCSHAPGSAGSSGGASAGGRSTPISLLSVLLSQQSGELSGGVSGDYEAEDDDTYTDDEDYPVDETAMHTGQGQPLPADDLLCMRTAPVAVPSTLWIKEPALVAELRRLHYERWQRRQYMEAQEAAQRDAALRAAAQHAAQQQQAYQAAQLALMQQQQAMARPAH